MLTTTERLPVQTPRDKLGVQQRMVVDTIRRRPGGYRPARERDRRIAHSLVKHGYTTMRDGIYYPTYSPVAVVTGVACDKCGQHRNQPCVDRGNMRPPHEERYRTWAALAL